MKTVIVGNQADGKTSLLITYIWFLSRYANKADEKPEIPAEEALKICKIKKGRAEKKCKK
jgi:Na+-transporting methylmalonyl-CoA/oxaloacetate decarboxylase gamma subunit